MSHARYHVPFALLSLLVGWFINWRAPYPVRPAAIDPPFVFAPRDRVVVALVGDTGEPGPLLDALRDQMITETKDLVIGLGDLVYPWGPRCFNGALTVEAKGILDERVGAFYEGMGAPTLMLLGNHEVEGLQRAPSREACMFDYAARSEALQMPALSYEVDVGPALIAVLNTNDLNADDGRRVRAALDAHDGWDIVVGHHVLRTYYDKESEDVVQPWFEEHGIHPHLYVNGHAHFLQFGVYGGVPAATIGASGKLRDRPVCPPQCGEGQQWGVSVRGYGMLEITPERLDLVIKDSAGLPLWRWSRTRTPP